MDPLRIFYQVIILIVVLGSIIHLLRSATKPACGDEARRCGLGKSAQVDLDYSRKQKRYWEKKLRRYNIDGQHSAILRTMIMLGNRDLEQIEEQLTMRPTCHGCHMQQIDGSKIESATRAFRSAEQIKRSCTFTHKLFS